MTLQHTEERLERAAEYHREAAYIKGLARALLELSEHLDTFPAGNDPARDAIKIMKADIKDKHTKALAEVARLETNAATLEHLVAHQPGAFI